jgi:hypothetical protein
VDAGNNQARFSSSLHEKKISFHFFDFDIENPPMKADESADCAVIMVKHVFILTRFAAGV